MSEFFLPGIKDRLADIAMIQFLKKVNFVEGSEAEVKNICKMFKTLEDLLQNAEGRKLEEEPVRAWLEEVEDLAYEMEEVLEEWNLKTVKTDDPQLGGPQQLQAPSGKLTPFLAKVRCCIPSPIRRVPVDSDIALKVKKIHGKLVSKLKEANKIELDSTPLSGIGDSSNTQRSFPSSIFDAPEVFGRDSDKDSLLKQLLPELMGNTSQSGVGENRIKVISIVGDGGMGKTTLAQFLYNHVEVNKNFQIREWVSVSGHFDEERIASSFYRKRLLLVLDGVCTEDSSKCERLINSLKRVSPSPKSIILVTTESESVAKEIGSQNPHKLLPLLDSDCWSIIQKITLSESPELCESFAKKCKGSPLAAKAIGSLLQFKGSQLEKAEILGSEIWGKNHDFGDLFPHLYLSYMELSPRLRRCFSFCAVFSKNADIDVDRLVRLWMAQGFLGRPTRTRDEMMEKKGHEYFKELAMRSFFHELREVGCDKNAISCKMHDIVHKFAQFVANTECQVFKEVDVQNAETEKKMLFKERLRHVTMFGVTKSFNSSAIRDIKKVRSLFLSCHGELSQEFCISWKSVRSLTLSSCGLQELPTEIGNLIHIRFLDVSNNEFKNLPESICDLIYLESLDVSGCLKLEHLPVRIEDLVNLRHLYNDMTYAVKQLPKGIEKLTSLLSLTFFNADGSQSLSIIAKLKSLERLNISGGGIDSENGSSFEIEEVPANLHVLELQDYQSYRLPAWIVTKSLVNNLRCLCISGAEQVLSLPALGKLSSLQSLTLVGLTSLERLGHDLYGFLDLQAQGHHGDSTEVIAFPRLKKLVIHNLENWETWEDISEDDNNVNNGTAMPLLEKLEIENCPELKSLPHQILGNARHLKILTVYNCAELKNRYSNNEGGGWMRKLQFH